jgi:hypothetical protein
VTGRNIVKQKATGAMPVLGPARWPLVSIAQHNAPYVARCRSRAG